MKQLSILCATALMVTSTPTLAAPASASQAEKRELQDLCYGLIASGEFPGLNLGECMSFNNTSDAGFKAHLCDFFRESGLLEELEMTYSECIRQQ
jgi:hypothetical protein